MPDLLYCYPNSNVLKNKFDIRDEEKLDKVERDIRIEGIRAKSMLVEGAFVDEYYMAKIL